MKKSVFAALIGALEKQHKHDAECDTLLEKVFPEARGPWYDNSALREGVIRVLESETGDAFGFIQYYIYELDFGRRAKEKPVIVDGAKITLDTPEKLYKFLTA